MKESNKELGIKIISNNTDINVLNSYTNVDITSYHIFGNCIEYFTATEYILKNIPQDKEKYIHIDDINNLTSNIIDVINSTKTIAVLNFDNISNKKQKIFFLLSKIHRLKINIDGNSLQETFKALNDTFIDTYLKINGYLPAININIDDFKNPVEDVDSLVRKINHTKPDIISFENYFFYEILNRINQNNDENIVPYDNYYITNEDNNINDYNTFLKLKKKLHNKCNNCQAKLLCSKNDIKNCVNKCLFYAELGYNLINNKIQRG